MNAEGAPANDADLEEFQGGNAVRARALAGYRYAFGDERAPRAGILLGGSYESYTAKDFREYDVVDSHTRTAIDVGLTGGFHVGPVAIDLFGGTTVGAAWTETEKLSGDSAEAADQPLWRLSARYTMGSLEAGLLYHGEARSVKFRGEPQLPRAGSQSDLELTETLHSVSISAAWRF